MNTESIIDVDLVREWDNASIGITVSSMDDSDLDNLLHQGYVIKTVTIL